MVKVWLEIKVTREWEKQPHKGENFERMVIFIKMSVHGYSKRR